MTKLTKQKIGNRTELIFYFLLMAALTFFLFLLIEFFLFQFSERNDKTGDFEIKITRQSYRFIFGVVIILGFIMGSIFVATRKSWTLRQMTERLENYIIAKEAIFWIEQKIQLSGWNVKDRQMEKPNESKTNNQSIIKKSR